MVKVTRIIVSLTFCLTVASGYHVGLSTFKTVRSEVTMRKGRPSLKKTINGGMSKSKPNPMGGKEIIERSRPMQWLPVAGLATIDDLPKEENKVTLINTMADVLMDAAVNPSGSVAVTTFEGNTFCFAASCAICKIPMDKAKIYLPTEESGKDVRVCCDFCGVTFNARTGKRLENAPERKAGLLGGLVKGLFNASPSVNLETYDLGEQDGKVMISVPK
mmetsp:Transcript_6333/g.13278  ORF Transcript_6333/g.13278 Transcript_6333/m.13278 type:complete len:218 (-) Transcript_6333:24-677(-)